MRILVDSSNYFADNDNLGDRATIQVVARRLLGLWPDAGIRFITGNCGIVERTHSGLQPLILGTRQRTETGPALEMFFAEVEAADLIVATGGGYYSDAFAAHALGVLSTLDVASQVGRPAVMMGAGFELVRDEVLLARSRAVLPRLAMIACREGATGPAYLRSLGVEPDRVVVTGDDSVELAYEARRARLGEAIGVNLRQAPYAGMDDKCVGVLGSVLADAEERHHAPLVPVPISLHGPSDRESIASLLGQAGGQALDTPQAVLEQVGECRLVVTGSYHAAVFALSQGIPVVGITDSLHYRTKLGGLAHQFGSGCTVLAVRDELFRERAAEAINVAWARAAEFRPELLAAAVDQIRAGRAAYRFLPGLLRSQNATGDAAARVGASGVWHHLPSEAGSIMLAQHITSHETELQAVKSERDAYHNICNEREVVIAELKHACDERQAEILALKHACDEREAEILALKHACDEREKAIKALTSACDMRQAKIEEITIEARLRDDVIRDQVAALRDAQQLIEERTTWAERRVTEAERRAGVIAELRAAVLELQARQTSTPPSAVHRGRRSVARLAKRLVAVLAMWWASMRERIAPTRPSRHT